VALIPRFSHTDGKGRSMKSGRVACLLKKSTLTKFVNWITQTNPRAPYSSFLSAEEKRVCETCQIIKMPIKNGFHLEISQHPNLRTLWNRLEFKGLASNTQENELTSNLFEVLTYCSLHIIVVH
jgi:hypothetical protein